MRIALVSPYDLSVPGGVQSQVLGLADALVHLGHTVAVIAPGRPGTWSVPGAKSTAVGRSLRVPVNGSYAPVAPSLFAMRRTARAVADFAPGVVHIHEPLVPGPALAALIGANVPVVATFHRARSSRVYTAYARVSRRFVRRVGTVIAVSGTAAQTLRAVIGDIDVAIVANAVATDRLARLQPARR
ncbi:MAG: glycosyltransferase family 4 protein, partial [Acidimicrobiales bacterium]